MATAQLPPPPRRGALRARVVRPRARQASNVDATAPLFDHLDELRKRILWSVAAFVVAFGLCYWKVDPLFHVLARPLGGKYPIQTLGVTEPFFTSLSIAAQAAFVVVSPIAAWNIWRFVCPAIPVHARGTVRVLLLVAPALFTAGVLFGYFVVLGPAVHVLLGLGPSDLHVTVRAQDYYSFVTMLLLAMGLVFCFPLALLGLARIGVISSTLLRKNRKIAVVLIFIIAALLPTVDPVSLMLEALPLLALYEVSIIAIIAQERRMAKRAAGPVSVDAGVIDV